MTQHRRGSAVVAKAFTFLGMYLRQQRDSVAEKLSTERTGSGRTWTVVIYTIDSAR